MKYFKWAIYWLIILYTSVTNESAWMFLIGLWVFLFLLRADRLLEPKEPKETAKNETDTPAIN